MYTIKGFYGRITKARDRRKATQELEQIKAQKLILYISVAASPLFLTVAC